MVEGTVPISQQISVLVLFLVVFYETEQRPVDEALSTNALSILNAALAALIFSVRAIVPPVPSCEELQRRSPQRKNGSGGHASDKGFGVDRRRQRRVQDSVEIDIGGARERTAPPSLARSRSQSSDSGIVSVESVHTVETLWDTVSEESNDVSGGVDVNYGGGGDADRSSDSFEGDESAERSSGSGSSGADDEEEIAHTTLSLKSKGRGMPLEEAVGGEEVVSARMAAAPTTTRIAAAATATTAAAGGVGAGAGTLIKPTPNRPDPESAYESLRTFALFGGVLSALSPLLQSLTQSFASDTLFALVTVFAAVHLFSHDYEVQRYALAE